MSMLKITFFFAVATFVAVYTKPISASANIAPTEQGCAAEQLFASAAADSKNGRWWRSIKSLQLLATTPVEDCETELLRLRAAILQGDLLWKRGAVAEGKELLAGARQRASTIGSEELAADAQSALAEIAYMQAHIMGTISSDEALEAYKLALKEAKHVGRGDLIARALGRIGVIIERRNDLASAQQYYVDSLSLAEEHDAKEMLHLPLTHLASIERRAGNMDTARHYYARAMEAARQSPAPEHLVFALINSARHKERTAEYTIKDALIDTYRALEIARRLDHQIAICLSYLALSSRNLENGNNAIAKSNAESARLTATENGFSVLEQLAYGAAARIENRRN